MWSGSSTLSHGEINPISTGGLARGLEMDDPEATPDQPTDSLTPPVTGIAQPGPQLPALVQPGNGLAIAGMILGITSIIFSWWGVFSLAQVILAIVFSSIGIQHANRGAAHKGMAVAGLTCGIIGGMLYVIVGIASLGVGFFI